MGKIILEKNDKFSIRLDCENFSEQDTEKLRLSVLQMLEAFSSEEFKKFCFSYSYEVSSCSGSLWWKKCTKRFDYGFRWNENKTQTQIYNHLLSGKETLSSEVDNEADVFLKLDRKNKRGVLGYTYANSTWQWIYNWFFTDGTVDEIAGNIAHEWCHKMGYEHEFNYSNLRDKTVPYAVGYFVRDYQGE